MPRVLTVTSPGLDFPHAVQAARVIRHRTDAATLDNPDAIERTGRNQAEGPWDRADRTSDGRWAAFTTEPKKADVAIKPRAAQLPPPGTGRAARGNRAPGRTD